MTPAAEFRAVGGRQLFCLRYRPESAPRARVLIVPPLVEELNKCRRLLHLAAQALCARGCEVLHQDLSGTGDSAGEFDQARWEDWEAELVNAAAADSGVPLVVLALRAGALLVPGLLGALDATPQRTVLLQPVLSGEQFLRQLIRVRVMASKFAGGDDTPERLAAELERGETVELSGYGFSPALAGAFGTAKLGGAAFAGAAEVRVLECRDGGADASPQMRRFTASAAEAGARIDLETIDAEPFWSSQEIVAPRAVVEAIVEACVDER